MQKQGVKKHKIKVKKNIVIALFLFNRISVELFN